MATGVKDSIHVYEAEPAESQQLSGKPLLDAAGDIDTASLFETRHEALMSSGGVEEGFSKQAALAKRARYVVGGIITLVLAVGVALAVFYGTRTVAPLAPLSAYQQACSIYCQGPLLQAVQSARIWNDSKTFVDMPM